MRRPRRVRLYLAGVHLKGGGWLPIVAEGIDVKWRGNDLTELSRTGWVRDARPMYIRLEEVQAVDVRRRGHRWVWR